MKPFEELKLKANLALTKQALCTGHIWGEIYISQIPLGEPSAACIRCGQRRKWSDIPKGDPLEMGGTVRHNYISF
jgi:hypothetical protein